MFDYHEVILEVIILLWRCYGDMGVSFNRGTPQSLRLLDTKDWTMLEELRKSFPVAFRC